MSTDDARQQAAAETLTAIDAMRRIARDARLPSDARLHYLRILRINANSLAAELQGDDLPPVLAEKFADVMYGIHRSAMEIDL